MSYYSLRCAAKFLSWLILDTSDSEFESKEWDIYDKSHWQYWAEPGEVITREATAYEKSCCMRSAFLSANLFRT